MNNNNNNHFMPLVIVKLIIVSLEHEFNSLIRFETIRTCLYCYNSSFRSTFVSNEWRIRKTGSFQWKWWHKEHCDVWNTRSTLNFDGHASDLMRAIYQRHEDLSEESVIRIIYVPIFTLTSFDNFNKLA